MIREELAHFTTWGDRHRRLIARLTIVALLTLIVDAVGTILIYLAERNAANSEITSLGDALFFTTVQLLTISSQMPNPVTGPGRIVDVGLEIFALFVVTALAGAFASFFLHVAAEKVD